jgi:AcrR family transcriptional regulator
MSTNQLDTGYAGRMPRDSAPTKARILNAATTEFAANGLAGARVDRIAERAGANKQLIYAYFGSKEALFDSTIETNIDRLLDEIPFDALDLPGYALAMFDFAHAHPELLRLLRWHILERPGVLWTLPNPAESTLRKVTALSKAQEAGAVDATLPAQDLLELLLSLIHSAAESYATGDTPTALAARRRAVAHGVRQLITPRRP